MAGRQPENIPFDIHKFVKRIKIAALNKADIERNQSGIEKPLLIEEESAPASQLRQRRMLETKNRENKLDLIGSDRFG
ncbi:hypothetical protein LINGRAHAP2_LOCUS8342 [Linum grandiflorum]